MMRPIFFSILILILPLIGCGGDNQSDSNISFVEPPPTRVKPPPTLGMSKRKIKIKSSAEIADDLEKVTIDAYVVDGDEDILGNIAHDLEKALPNPLGEFSSRLALLTRRLIIVFKFGFYMEGWEVELNKILEDTLQLKAEISETASTMPEADKTSLVFLEELGRIVGRIQITTESLDKKLKEIIINNIVLQRNLMLKYENEKLDKEIKFKSELLMATRLLKELVRKCS